MTLPTGEFAFGEFASMEFAKDSYRTVWETVFAGAGVAEVLNVGGLYAHTDALLVSQSNVDGRISGVQQALLNASGVATASILAQRVSNTTLSAAGITTLSFVLGSVSLQTMTIGGLSYAQFDLVGDAGFDTVNGSSSWFPTAVLANFTTNIAGFSEAVFQGEAVTLTEVDIACLSEIAIAIQAIQQVSLSVAGQGGMLNYAQPIAYSRTTIAGATTVAVISQAKANSVYAIAGLGNTNLTTSAKTRVYGSFLVAGVGATTINTQIKEYKAAQFAAPSEGVLVFNGNNVNQMQFAIVGTSYTSMMRGRNVLKLLTAATMSFPRPAEVREFPRPAEVRIFGKNT